MEILARNFGHPTGALGRTIALLMATENVGDYALCLRHAGLRNADTVLDIGCASAAHVAGLPCLSGRRYIGVDVSPDMIEMASGDGGEFLCLDVCKDDMPACDIALAVNTVQWWRDLPAAFRNIYAALSHGGRLVIGVPARRGVPPFVPQVGQVYREADELSYRLKSAGFVDVDANEVRTARRPFLIVRGVKA